jgi:hypothetical protein
MQVKVKPERLQSADHHLVGSAQNNRRNAQSSSTSQQRIVGI